MVMGSLIGQKLNLMVSDPWDFGTEHGVGPFDVIVQGESNTALLLQLVRPLKFKGATWEFLAATPRHKEDRIKMLLHGSKVHVNVIRVEESEAKSDPLSFGWKGYRGGNNMLIGTLRYPESIWQRLQRYIRTLIPAQRQKGD